MNCVHHSGKLIKMAAHVLKLDVHTERESSLRVSASHVKHILELFMTERHVDQRFAMIDKCSYQMVLVKIALTTKEPWARIRSHVEGLFAIQDKFFLLMEGVPTATLTQEHLLINCLVSHTTAMIDRCWVKMVVALTALNIPEHKVTVPNVTQTHATTDKRSHRMVHANTARSSSPYAKTQDAAPDQTAKRMRSSLKQDSAIPVLSTRDLHHQTDNSANLIH